jgi:hypothetical protein
LRKVTCGERLALFPGGKRRDKTVSEGKEEKKGAAVAMRGEKMAYETTVIWRMQQVSYGMHISLFLSR